MTREILLTVDGQPPTGDPSLWFYNPHHPQYPQVVRLREAAAAAVAAQPDWDPHEEGWLALAVTVVMPAGHPPIAEATNALAGVAEALQATPVDTDVPGCSLYRDVEQIRVVLCTAQDGDAPAYSVRVRVMGYPS